MLFNSAEFLCAFLPLALLCYHLARRWNLTLAMGVLTCASLFYYAWWNPPYVLVIGLSLLFNYSCSHVIARADHWRKLLMILGVAANLGALFFFKYTNFFMDQVNLFLTDPVRIRDIVLPLGISFFTFQQVACLVDVYQKKVEPGKFLTYTTFVTFFPQLIAGPIVHHSQMMPQFDQSHYKGFNWQDMSVGITIFAMGLFKKVAIADNLSPVVQFVFDNVHHGKPVTSVDAWIGVLAYTFQIYFDFSGYSDMAIGVGRMFGIVLPLNFYSPYKSSSIIDFWRRWHITLSTFLRDYLYIPLGGNRHGKFNRYRNLMLTMLLGGIWHGAGWGFVLWGTLHGVYLVINHGWRNLINKFNLHTVQSGRLYRFTCTTVTFGVVMVSWIFFRAHTWQDATTLLVSMTNIHHFGLPESVLDVVHPVISWAHVVPASLTVIGVHQNNVLYWLPLAMFIALIMPNTEQFMSTQHESYSPLPREKSGWLVFHFDWVCLGMTVFCILFSLYNIVSMAKTEFLYYDF